MRENIFAHFGVLGMKWGVRKNRSNSSDYEVSKKLKKRPLKSLSNKELSVLVNRMDLEKRLRNLKKDNVSEGKKVARKIFERIGDKAIDIALREVIAKVRQKK